MSKKINGNYLAVETYLFQMKLNPTEILIMAKVAEINRNCEKCYISDETLAQNYGVSKSTISRAIKRLNEECGFLIKETKNVKGGKERVLSLNEKKIKEYLTNVNLSVDDEEKQDLQQANCLLTTSKLPIDNKQNELIKENTKEKEKENYGEIEKPTALSISLQTNQEEEEIKEAGESIDNPIYVEKMWLAERYNNLTELANGVFMYNKKYYKIKENK